MLTAMIFAAGLGTRLRPLTESLPKPLIEISGQPMLAHLADSLKQAGVDRLVLNTHWLPKQIERFAQTKLAQDFEVFLSHEPTLLGTGGGLFAARNWLEGELLLVNADVLTNLDFGRFLHQHQAHGAGVSLAVNRERVNSNLLLDEEGQLVGIERAGQHRLVSEPCGESVPYNFCGIHALQEGFLSRLKQSVEFSLVEEYLKQVSLGAEIKGIDITGAYCCDIGTLKTLEQARADWPHLSGTRF